MIKILIDHKALERLIGNDTEAEIAIREGIIQTFAKKHLKSLAKADTFEPILEGIQKSIVAMFQAEMPVTRQKIGGWANRHKWVLARDSDFYKELKTSVKKAASELLNAELADAQQAFRLECKTRFDHHVDVIRQRITREVNEQFSERFKDQVEAEITRRIRELASLS